MLAPFFWGGENFLFRILVRRKERKLFHISQYRKNYKQREYCVGNPRASKQRGEKHHYGNQRQKYYRQHVLGNRLPYVAVHEGVQGAQRSAAGTVKVCYFVCRAGRKKRFRRRVEKIDGDKDGGKSEQYGDV